VRGAIFRAIPTDLKTAISVGIGLSIALVGFVDAGFVASLGGTGRRRLRMRRHLHPNRSGEGALFAALHSVRSGLLVLQFVR
jgi:xanthine/uracil/vitamin C permease (AzgA family)